MGLVVVILTTAVNGYDLIADPVGWVPVLGGAGAGRHTNWSLGRPVRMTLRNVRRG
jgi:hypothetical protein